ncbi:antitoxin VbhA family protein [Hymenobacter sp. B81]|uniref:antitoxin VbhA family protein n=1 Tax=Hymenobacter sp. B81 TaxID=3344878 RepID=UPI0037DCAC95
MKQPQFLPQEATVAQRRAIMERGFAAGRAQGAIITPETEAVYNRYVNGEITLEQATAEAMRVYQPQGAAAQPVHA